jgi:hypothetical protein
MAKAAGVDAASAPAASPDKRFRRVIVGPLLCLLFIRFSPWGCGLGASTRRGTRAREKTTIVGSYFLVVQK